MASTIGLQNLIYALQQALIPSSYQGVVGAGSDATHVVDASGGFAVDQWADWGIQFTQDTATAALRGVWQKITSNTADTHALAGALPAVPAAGDTYNIRSFGAAVQNIQSWGGTAQTGADLTPLFQHLNADLSTLGTEVTLAEILAALGGGGGAPVPTDLDHVGGTAQTGGNWTPKILGVAQDGTDADGVVPLTGGGGIRGWLSSIFSLLSGGTAKTIMRGGAKGATAAADVTSTSVDGDTQALHVAVAVPVDLGDLNGAAQDGVDADGVVPLTGGGGIRGWLSSIFSLLSGGTAKTIMRGGAKGATAAADVTSTSVDADTQALHVAVAEPVDLGDLNGAAQDGTDADGVVPLTGGGGIRGWLSSIFSLLSGGTAKTIMRGGAKGGTAAADVTSTSVDADTQALHVAVAGTAATSNAAASQEDGHSATLGATDDAAVTGDAAGTVSAKLRGVSKIWAAVWDNVNNLLKVSVFNGANQMPAGDAAARPIFVNPNSLTPVLLRAAINTAASGDNTIISAVADKKIYITHLDINNTAASATTVILKDGASAINGTGFKLAADGGGYTFDGNEFKQIIGSTNTAFVINLSASNQVNGFVIFYTA